MAGVVPREGLVNFREIVSEVVVVHRRVAVSASGTHIQWEFGPDLKGPLQREGPETVPLAEE